MSENYNIGEDEYYQIKLRIEAIWDLITHPVKGNAPNLHELGQLSNLARMYEDHVEWDKYKEKFWESLFSDLKE